MQCHSNSRFVKFQPVGFGLNWLSIMAIAKSDISPNLDRQQMFSDLWFCNYCFCYGTGLGAVGDPFFGAESKNLCIHQKCQMTDIGDPFCSSMGVFCCVTSQCQFPAMSGSPTCVCFNKPLAGQGGSDWKPSLFDYSPTFDKTFWIYYLLCLGCGVEGLGKCSPAGGERPLYGVEAKMLCIKNGSRLVPPVEEGVFCSSLGSFLCCWSQCELPPASGNPGFDCLGLLGKAKGKGPMKYGAK